MESSIVQQDTDLISLSLPLYQAKGWIRFLGVMSIIQGAFAAITIWGIIFAWLPIWVGVLLFQSAGSLEAAHLSGDKNQFLAAGSKLKTYFIIQGVTLLVGIVLSAIVIFTVGMGAMLGLLGEF